LHSAFGNLHPKHRQGWLTHRYQDDAASPFQKYGQSGKSCARLISTKEKPMQTISKDAPVQTVITTFEMSPGTCHDLLDALTGAYADFISKQPGFVAASLHVNDAQTRIANYSQWRSRDDFQAMLRSEEMRARNRNIHDLCRSFEPVMYEVAADFG
jgi:heme-degrading monooxygenase HmoA